MCRLFIYIHTPSLMVIVYFIPLLFFNQYLHFSTVIDVLKF